MLVYTFRTCPYINELKNIFPDVFIFGNLKEGLKAFEMLLKNSPNSVLGIASTKGRSRIETTAINRFNKGKLEKHGQDELKLYIDPRLKDIKIEQRPTATFCNWTMYRVQTLINLQDLNTKFSFVHLNPNDISKLKTLAQ